MNFRVELKEAIIQQLISDVAAITDSNISSRRFNPLSVSELPYVTVNSFDDEAEQLADLHTYKLTSQVLVTAYAEGETAEDDVDILAGAIEDSLLNPMAEFLTSTGAICKTFTLRATKIRRADRTNERDIVFASMLFEAEGYREVS